jgi:hypothetical protein
VIPDSNGAPAYTGTFISTIDHRTPLAQRWGGWYVTGSHGTQQHMGNAVAPDARHPLDLALDGSQNLVSLEGRFDLSKHLAGTSDIVALMTLEHQVGAANRINALTYQYNRTKHDGLSDDDWKMLAADIHDLVDYMLFMDEARLTEPVRGVSTFTRTFPQRGPTDDRGRSLRDFDLKTRLFRYRLSYMVYSPLFDGMPAPILARVYERLHDILTGDEEAPKYRQALSAEERQEALEILIRTKPTLPLSWKGSPN